MSGWGYTLNFLKNLFYRFRNARDIAINTKNPEFGFFNKRSDAVWTKFLIAIINIIK